MRTVQMTRHSNWSFKWTGWRAVSASRARRLLDGRSPRKSSEYAARSANAGTVKGIDATPCPRLNSVAGSRNSRGPTDGAAAKSGVSLFASGLTSTGALAARMKATSDQSAGGAAGNRRF